MFLIGEARYRSLAAPARLARRKRIKLMNKITSFLKEVYIELTKVTWLGRKDVVRSTVAVSFVVILIAIYVSLVDLGLNTMLKVILGGR